MQAADNAAGGADEADRLWHGWMPVGSWEGLGSRACLARAGSGLTWAGNTGPGARLRATRCGILLLHLDDPNCQGQ
jgi:hypothetical protein